jgi:hypothetical protein
VCVGGGEGGRIFFFLHRVGIILLNNSTVQDLLVQLTFVQLIKILLLLWNTEVRCVYKGTPLNPIFSQLVQPTSCLSNIRFYIISSAAWSRVEVIR